MKKQPYPVAQLTGGLDVSVDGVFLVDKNSPYLRNVRFDKGLIRKGLGWVQFGTGLPLDGTPILIDTFPTADGTIHQLMVTTKWVYKYNESSNDYTKKNPTVQFTGDESNQFSCVTTLDSAGNEIFILTNGKDKIQKWDGSAGNFADLAGWSTGPVLARRLVIFKSRLLAGFTVEGGTVCTRRVRWSVAGNPEDITGTGSGFVDLAETSDWVVALVPLKNKLFIFKERSIWELPYKGGADVFGGPILKIDGVGTYSNLSIVSLGDELIFYGTDNIYLFDGENLDSIGKNIYSLVYETEKRLVNVGKADRVPSVYIEELKSYQLCFPTGESEIPSLLAEYSFDYQSWTLRDIQITAFGYYTVSGQPRWVDMTGTWEAQTGIWMQKKLPSGAPTTLIGTPDGYIYEDDRITKSTDYMVFQTKDWVFQHAQRVIEFRVQARGGPFNCYYSLDQGLTWSGAKTFSFRSDWAEYVWFLNLTCQSIRMKIESSAEDLDIKWVEPWYIPRVRSKGIVTN